MFYDISPTASELLNESPDRIEELQIHADGCMVCRGTRTMNDAGEWFNLALMEERCPEAKALMRGSNR